MDLTPEQLASIVQAVLDKVEAKLKPTLQKLVEDLELPDVKGLITKKAFQEAIEALKTGFNDEFKKTNEAVTKIATETETKIQALTPPKSKPWYATVIDWDE